MRNIDNIIQNAASESTRPSPLDLGLDQNVLLEFRNQAILSNLMTVSILTNQLLQEGPWKSINKLVKSLSQHNQSPKMTPSYKPPFLDEDNESNTLRRKKQIYLSLVNLIKLLRQLLSTPTNGINPIAIILNQNSGLILTRPIPKATFYRALVNQYNRMTQLNARTNPNPTPQNQAAQQNDIVLAPSLPGFDDAHGNTPHMSAVFKHLVNRF